MNPSPAAPHIPLNSPGAESPAQPALDAKRWRQVALITVGALALFTGIRFLPTGTNLSHMDFRVQAGNSIQFCDPLNPQFLPVVDVRSPVSLALTTGQLRAGEAAPFTLTLTTFTGKHIGPADLLVAHTRKLHLLIVDPTLTDYQHVHPEPGRVPGEWTGTFTPRHGGLYRVFADFTPVATGRGLYASADLVVAGELGRADSQPSLTAAGGSVEVEGIRFALTSVSPLRVAKPADLSLVLTRPDGGRLTLEPIMGAFAHLVAFDEARSGFAHLHPNETDLNQPPDPTHPRLTFKISFPQPGRYVIWAQVKITGHEVYAPFALEVIN